MPGSTPPRKRSDSPRTTSAVTNLRIVLVDNLLAYRQKMKGWIVDAGGTSDEVLEAGSAEEALELIAHREYAVDVVVCEWDDENVGGERLVTELRRSKDMDRIGMIAVVGNEASAIRAAKAAGANEVVVKPVQPVDLLKALSSIQRGLRPRTDSTRRRLQAAAATRSQSTKLSSTIAQELRAAGKLGKYKAGGVIARGKYLGRLYWVESGSVFVREKRSDGVEIEYRASPGKFFGEAAFVGEAITDLLAICEFPSIVGWQEADAVAKTIERLPILTHYFKTITVDRNRNNVVVEAEETVPGSLKGTLESLAFPDLVQMIVGTKKTGQLRIESAGEAAMLYFIGGALRHAECGTKSADEAVYRIVAWPAGRFLFTPQPPWPGAPTITGDPNMLIMEGMRRRESAT
jgi:CheY-like chemotaxis protein